MQVKIICATHLPKAAQRRVEKEEWQTDGCPLVQEHELSAAAVVSPCVVVEVPDAAAARSATWPLFASIPSCGRTRCYLHWQVRGGTFAAAGHDLDDCRHGDVWTSKTVQRNGLSPSWMQTVEIGVSDPELGISVHCRRAQFRQTSTTV